MTDPATQTSDTRPDNTVPAAAGGRNPEAFVDALRCNLSPQTIAEVSPRTIEAQAEAQTPADTDAAQEALLNVARQKLCLPGLGARGSDRLDFPEIGIWRIRAALEAAYNYGYAAGHAAGQTYKPGLDS